MNRSAATKPKLLFLSQTLPFPPDGGVKVRTYNVMRLLARTFDITALCFYRSKGGALATDVAHAVGGLSPLGRIEAFPIEQEESRARLVLDHARSVMTRRAYTVFTYQSARYQERLTSHLRAGGFDLVHADSLDLSGYFELVSALPLVCVHHDAQSVLLRRRARLEASRWRGRYVAHQAELMEREERSWCPRVSMNVCVSEIDAQALRHVAPTARFAVVPNGVDTDYFRPSTAGRSGAITFVGGTTWYPNKDALEFFTAEILPRLRALGVDNPVTWVGRASAAEIRAYGDRGITLTGYVDDIRPWVDRSSCFVVPIRIGGGTRVKILDAWAMGLPIVSTTIGCEGLATRNGRNIVVQDEPGAFAQAVAGILRDPSKQAALGQEGRATASSTYSWDALEPAMKSLYLGLIRSMKSEE